MNFITKNFPESPSNGKSETTKDANPEVSLTIEDVKAKLPKTMATRVEDLVLITGKSPEEVISMIPEIATKWNEANKANVYVSLKERIEERLADAIDTEAIKALKDVMYFHANTAVQVTFYLNNKRRLGIKVRKPFNYSKDSKYRPDDLHAEYEIDGKWSPSSEWFK